MKHETIATNQSDVPIARLSDEEIEARVFRNLELQKNRGEEELAGAIVLLQYPDNRTLLQRLAEWWRLRYRPAIQAPETNIEKNRVEQVWQGHWSLTKYL
ncbi:hypothetical protein [uncultured Tateyamaria sp.]|uniref:hypothetical protein n=1 Tax=uncultured Tateyamaria sp. TaxID=455651 RepID=UPI002627FFD4|nr:hypothetical protein [uncultured Tateyamaria sp.]